MSKTKPEIKICCSYTDLYTMAECVPNPRNPNKHPDEQIKRLAEIIKHTGFRSPIVISSRSGFIVKGHGRLLAAQVLQMDRVPVDVQNYESEAQEWSDMVADNRLAELSEIDNSMLSELLSELPEIDYTGFTDEEMSEILEKLGTNLINDAESDENEPETEKSNCDIECPECGHVFESRLTVTEN